MRKRTSSPLRLSLLSYAIAAAAAGGAAQSAFAEVVDLCSGLTAITVSQDESGISCSLDTTGATLTVTAAGVLNQGVYASATNASVANDGEISASRIGGSGTTTALLMVETNGSVRNSGSINAYFNGYYGSALGIDADSVEAAGVIDNSGDISASGYGYGMSAAGISVGSLEGRISNSGDISASVSAGSGSGYYGSGSGSGSGYYGSGGVAQGIVLDLLSATGSLNNAADATIRASAYGYNVDAVAVRAGSIQGTLSNAGDFDASISGAGTATGLGFYDAVGTIINTGTISASLNESGNMGNGSATAIDGGMLSGSLSNSGDIMASGYGYYVTAEGVSIGSLSGSLTNTAAGGIEAEASGYYADARAVVAEDFSGDLVNSGRIAAGADGNYGAYAFGVLIGDEYTRYARMEVFVTGPTPGNVISGSLVNSGEIQVQAIGGSRADATGLKVQGDLEVAVTNSGSIEAFADAYSYGDAVGVHLAQYSSDRMTPSIFAMVEESSASFVNTGTISASSNAYYALATSLHVEGSFDGDITNEGDLLAYAGPDEDESQNQIQSAYAYGVYITGSLETTLENKGTISAFASANGGGAYGVRVNTLYGIINNSGTIEADGDVSSGVLRALHVSGGSGQVINSGLIDGGVYLGDAVSLSNSGSIVLSAGKTGYMEGRYTQQAGGRLVFNASSDSEYGNFEFAGTADFTAGNNVHVQVDPANTLATDDSLGNIITSGSLLLPDSGLFEVTDSSVFWTFAQEVDEGTLTLTATELSTEQALAGSGLSGSQVDLVEEVMGDLNGGTYSDLALALFNAPTAQAAADVIEEAGPLLPSAPGNAARAASLGASNAISARLNARRGASSGDAFQDNSVWIKPFLGKAEQDAVGTLNGYDVDNSGFIIGIDGDISDSWRVGLAVASSQGDVESSNSGIDLSSTHLALYGTYALSDTAALDLDVTRVTTGYDSTRQVGFANSTARANFDGSQFGLGLALSKRVAMGEKSSFEPSVAVRYNRVSIDGYNETGAGAFNLVVDDVREDSMLWSAKGSFEFGVGKGAILANAGVGYDTLDAASVSATFAGAGPTFTSTGAKPDSTVLMGGLGYRYVTAKSFEIDAMLDVESRGDFQAQTASVKFKLPF